jgi:alkylhydroperoxidase family enzyme
MHHQLPYPPADQLPADVAKRQRERPPINLYRVMVNAPQVLIPWTDCVQAVYDSTIPARLREIAIVRQAARAKAGYELHQHTFIALANGLSEEEVRVLKNPAPVTSLSETENLVCAMSDQLEQSADLDDETYERARSVFEPREFVEVITVISFYCAVARFTNATRLVIETDNPLAGHASPN